jgi:hypothetical protein
MDTKLYVEWRETLKKWVVKFQGRVIAQQDTQAEAQKWIERNYPSQAYETERVALGLFSLRTAISHRLPSAIPPPSALRPRLPQRSLELSSLHRNSTAFSQPKSLLR